jgi:hypothetical protein
MRRGGQERLGHHDHSCRTTFTSHLEAVGSRPLFGTAPDLVGFPRVPAAGLPSSGERVSAP